MIDYSKCPFCGGDVYRNYKYQIHCDAPVGGCLKTRYIAENEAIHNAIHDSIEAARQEEREACAGIMDAALAMLGEAGMYQAATLMRAYAKRIREGK